MKLAFLFPGQGSQRVGMGHALAERYPVAREVFEVADQVLGFPLSRICWEGPEEELKQTFYTQPALLTHSVAALRLLEAAGVRPTWSAGHSLGEYSACVAAGVLGFEDAVRLVHRRGELMHRAGIERPGTMAAILGLADDEVREVCAEASSAGIVQAANFNAPGQVAVSGEIAAVERACAVAKARGARRAVRLDVAGAFHSPLMASAAEGLKERLGQVAFRDAQSPVVSNVSAEPLTQAQNLRAALEEQLLGAVRWAESMNRLLDLGAEVWIEIGSGRVLRGLMKHVPQAPFWNVEDPESLDQTLGAIGAGGTPARRV